MTEQELLDTLTDVLDYAEEPIEVVGTFEGLGVMTDNLGLVLRAEDGSEFHVTVVQSKARR